MLLGLVLFPLHYVYTGDIISIEIIHMVPVGAFFVPVARWQLVFQSSWLLAIYTKYDVQCFSNAKEGQ